MARILRMPDLEAMHEPDVQFGQGEPGQMMESALDPMMEGLPADVAIDLSRPTTADMVDGAMVTEGPDGVTVDFDPQGENETGTDAEEFNANLAEHMAEGDLARIAQTVEEWVKADVQSRKDWHDRLAEGLELLGVKPDKDASGPFKLTAKVTHPLLAEAAVQFQARSIAELIPAGGPAKTMVLGESSEDLEERGERVKDYMNYQLMVEDRDYFTETDRMLFILALNGSQFKKVYPDPLLGMNVSRWVRGEDFIVPYGVTTLFSAPRYTHQITLEPNDMRKLQRAGYYRDIELTTPVEGPERSDKTAKAKDEAQGQTNAGEYLLDDAIPHTAWECHCDFDLKGFEDKDEFGEPTGIGLPYVISVDKESRAVLSIRRNWKESDEKKKKRISFVHFPYLPGDGFYSFGLVHMIGGLTHAATGLLRIIMIGAAFAAMRGGFKSKDTKLPSNIELEFGKWQDTDMTSDELKNGFYEPQFKEPGESLFKVLGLLTEAGQRFSSTTEVMVGDASNMGPVGTTVALIEEGKKVFSGIHKRLHNALGEELRILADLNGEYLPEEGYPYKVEGGDRQIYREDFGPEVDVMPVSDPNIFSSTQRIAIAQALVQRADVAPQLYNRRKVEKRLLEAMRVADPDDVLADKAKVQRADPVTENALLMVGRPVKAFLDQDHDSHIAVHMDQLHKMEAEKNPILQQVAPSAMAHAAEHMAYGYMVQTAQQMGIQLPPVNLDAEDDEPVNQVLPPQIENQIAQRAAQAIQQARAAMQQQQAAAGAPGGDAGAQQGAELQKQAEALQQQAAELDQQRADMAKEGEATKREQMKLGFQQREAKLREQMGAMQSAAAGQTQTAAVKKLLDEAVAKVEKALSGGQGTPKP